MRTYKEGLIISISSIAGLRPISSAGAAYSASKHAMTALTKVVGLEEMYGGIRTTVISPGEVNTAFLDHRSVKVSAEHRLQILQPEDIADVVLFVATLPPHVCISELVIKPTTQVFV
jgi:NADP-dependent 3-hydroxy acid dehydrogenase YdfG